ncbi:MAG: 5'-methylthioadenosine/adenosylhomocysteine nucleosidase [Turicibacter sp.]|nr:5'-methylthioadenosine/adenosylhomocysteine nucleosidase [Turicibacter sp.]
MGKRIGIIGAMDIEIQEIKKWMGTYQTVQKAGFTFYVSEFVVLTSCGVGKVNASCCTQLLIDTFQVSAIINTGIAGGLHPEVETLDMVLSSTCTYHDVRPVQMASCFPFQEAFIADPALMDLAKEAFEKLETGSRLHVGKIVTGESFVSSSQHKEEIVKGYAPHCVEMEGAAIAHVAHLNQVPFLIIRCISDMADGNAALTYEQFEIQAASLSANLVCLMLEGLSGSENETSTNEITMGPEDFKVVDACLDKLLDGHSAKVGGPALTTSQKFAISLKGDGQAWGGICGTLQLEHFHINGLAVDESLRGQNWGMKLVHALEKQAIQTGAKIITLSTLSYQALGFYQKAGYEVYGTLPNCPVQGVTKYHLHKVVAP